MSNTLLTCSSCLKEKDAWVVEFRDMLVNGTLQPICSDCYAEKYIPCGNCEKDTLKEESRVHDGKTWCKECFDQHYFVCIECNITFRRGDSRNTPRGPVCRECYSQGEIQSYSYKPEPKFKAMPGEDHRRFMGLELEIDSSGADVYLCSKELYKIAGKDSYNKGDGSLRCGFEIVTHPMTLKYHLEKYPWTQMMQKAKEHGFKSHSTSTCGLHVHLNREAFGRGTEQDYNLMKLILFFEKNWPQLVRFSRRKVDGLRSWAKPHSWQAALDNESMCKTLFETAKNRGDRYMAVNLCSRSTVEIRIFRGTLKENSLFATLELLDILMQKIPKMSFQETVSFDFFKLLDIARELNYQHLVDYIKERKILEKMEADSQTFKTPVVGDEVVVSGRVRGLPNSSGHYQGMLGIVTRINAENMSSLVAISEGEYWIPNDSLSIYNPNEENPVTEE